MASESLLDRYLEKHVPGYVAGSLSTETVAFAAALDAVAKVEPRIVASVRQELADQRSHLKLIASENFATAAKAFRTLI